MPDYIICQTSPVQNLNGEMRVPGDKSISHRALILGAIAKGRTQINGFLMGEDNLATLTALQQLGVSITVVEDENIIIIEGVGLQGLKPSSAPLDLKNSGTGFRLLTGILSAQPFNTTLIGDASLTERPMGRIVHPLRMMGANIETSPTDTPPLTIFSRKEKLKSISYPMPIASAQVKSCLLLAGLYANGKTEIIEPAPSRDHLERLLSAFHYPLEKRGSSIVIQGGQELLGTTINIPADISSAAFFIVAATITPGSMLLLKEVGINPTRIGIITLLKRMGAHITLQNIREQNGEPIADISVKFSPLKGITITQEEIPFAIDEFPILAIAAAAAEGSTSIRGAAELRVKETDRISTIVKGLKNLSIEVQEFHDGLTIQGGTFQGGNINSNGDHRIAMAFIIAGNIAKDKIIINNCAPIQTSFPNFFEKAASVGMHLNIKQRESIPIITIDGPSGCGKGTLAALISETLGWNWLDSGIIYRAIAWTMLTQHINPGDEAGIKQCMQEMKLNIQENAKGALHTITCNGKDITLFIRNEDCAMMASKIGTLSYVRQGVLTLQRNFKAFPGLVTDGRDMGTVVFPEAILKFFLTANLEERAERRYLQLQNQGISVSLRSIQEDLAKRDQRDKERLIAPAVPAKEAIIIDTSHMSIQTVFKEVMAHVAKLGL